MKPAPAPSRLAARQVSAPSESPSIDTAIPSSASREIEGLQDQDPRRFRTQGLRNLAKAVCKVIRDYGPAHCAINATGGFAAAESWALHR